MINFVLQSFDHLLSFNVVREEPIRASACSVMKSVWRETAAVAGERLVLALVHMVVADASDPQIFGPNICDCTNHLLKRRAC
jgi:hypothetical protein